MNLDNMKLLINTIRVQLHTTPYDSKGFNMLAYRHDCGSPCCIAGFAAALSAPSKEDRSVIPPGIMAMRWLEIPEVDADHLFRPYDVTM